MPIAKKTSDLKPETGNWKLETFFKGFFSLFLVYCLLFIVTATSLAEDTPLQKADNDYAYQYGKYIQTHEDYLNSKSSFQTFKTATSKNEAFQKTKDYLIQVHAVYISYLLLTKEIGNSFDWGENSASKNDIAKNLDTEISFLYENVKKVDNTQTLEELPPISTDLSIHIKKTTNGLVNTTQVTYRLTEAKTRLKTMSDLSVKLDNYARQKLPHDKYDSFFANWNSEVKKIQTNSQTILDAINKKLGSKSSFSESDVVFTTEQTNAILATIRQANTLFSEVLSL